MCELLLTSWHDAPGLFGFSPRSSAMLDAGVEKTSSSHPAAGTVLVVAQPGPHGVIAD